MLAPSASVLAFTKKAKPGDIVSVRGEDWMGKLIRWVSESNVNHTALYIGNGLLIESTLGFGVRILPVDVYLNDPKKQVFLSRIKQDFEFEDIIRCAYKYYGIKYDLFGQTGILTKYLVKKIGLNRVITFFGKNKANSHGMWCSEFIGDIFATKNIKFIEEDTTYLTPGEIYNSESLVEIRYLDIL